MPTTKTRIAISVDKSTEEMLRIMAKRDKMPVASKAAELLWEAVEMQEDLALGALMDKRMKEMGDKKMRWIPHDEFWKAVRAGRKPSST